MCKQNQVIYNEKTDLVDPQLNVRAKRIKNEENTKY